MNPSTPGGGARVRRCSTTVAAFVLGLPLAAGALGVLYGPLKGTPAFRYVEHRVECVEVVMFCCALGTLGAKLWQNVFERRALRAGAVPAWDGRPAAVSEAPKLLAGLNRLARRAQNTYLVQRVSNVLEFLCQRQSAAGLDDHLRGLADADALALEGSYALTRFITWAVPILGFLGTVLGITGAISNVSPEVLEKSLSGVTGGLAFAFDATALALGLTMVTMFCSFLVERQEQGVLDAVDLYVDRQLAHRFQRAGADTGPVAEAVRQNAQAVLDAMGQLVQRQADVWAQTIAETEKRSAEGQARLTGALEAALERTLHTHAQRLAALEQQAVEQGARLLEQMTALAGVVRDTAREQQAALTRVAEGIAAQAAVLGNLQRGEENLVHLQAVLHQNLAVLAGAGSFDQAVHSLTAAIHLLMNRLGAAPQQAAVPRPHPGKAA
jgi:biopolymer transport protein ExbB/TolQ